MATIITRAGKGAALTNTEVDANFSNLNTDKLEADSSATLSNKTISGANNTLSNIGNSSLTNSAITFGATSQALGSTLSALNGVAVGSTTPSTGAFTSLTATLDSTFSSTGAVQISTGTTAERPSGVVGKMRYNSTTNQFEGYSGASPAWKSIGGSALSNDTSTATNLYPVFAGATTGTAENLYTGNARLLYKPSTGDLQSTTVTAQNGIFVNSATVSENQTIATGTNAMSAGPLVVANGVTVTVANGSTWTVV